MNASRFLFACLLCLTFSAQSLLAQTPHALVPGIQIDSLFRTQPNPNRMALDPISGNLFYCLPGGNVYEVMLPSGQAASETLRFTIADHGIQEPQGMCFVDSMLFLSGHTPAGAGYVTARISKGTLQGNGNRAWTTVVQTAIHPASTHPFTSVIADRAGDFLYWASGARTMAGEVSTNGGIHPGRREGPFNSRLYRFPIETSGLTLPNDSAALDSSGYVYCLGLRNAYSMAFNDAEELISIDNSGERDDPEELNWLRQGHHYGFPWRMGDHWNPLMNPNYDVNQDPLVNHLCGGYLQGIFAATPDFPTIPPNLVFTDPMRNLGPDADYYRDSITGEVYNASDEISTIASFTPHRSPLGLTIDRDSLLGGDFSGRAYVLSYMPGGDSTGMSPVAPWGTPGPFVDPAQDLLQLDISDAGLGEYVMSTHRIIDGFYLPVDAVLRGNEMYVIEQRGGARQNLWRVTFPLASAVEASSLSSSYDLLSYPNPTAGLTTLALVTQRADRVSLKVYDLNGRVVMEAGEWAIWPGRNAVNLDLAGLSGGMYLLRVSGKMGNGWLRVVRD